MILLAVVPLMIMLYHLQVESVEEVFYTSEQLIPSSFFDQYMSNLKKLALFDPQNEAVYRQNFKDVLETKISLHDFFKLKHNIIANFSWQSIQIAGFIILFVMLVGYFLAKNIVNRFKKSFEAEKNLIKKESVIQNLNEWQLLAKQVVHEVKGPLTPMRLIATDLQNKHQELSNADFSEYIAKVEILLNQQVEKLNALVENFAKFGRLPKAELKSISGNEFFDLVKKTSYFVSEKNCTFSFEANDLNFVIKIDLNLFQNVILNIINNAIEENAELDIKISIVKSDVLHLDICNNGKIIPQNIVDNLFKPDLKTTKKSEKNMGLGLTIVRKIVYEHQGEIILNTNDLNNGVCFRILLPLER